MKRSKIIGLLIILTGILILFYKEDEFYGWGGYVDKSWENIIISFILIAIGVLFVKKSNRIN
ncbi:hypothetical protein [Tenacibaculum sp.]|uniref:hypothetical protein n=1 Tax=Tenacibaculum sp. TaxID=1906242 RepID=UPI003AA8E34F